MNVIASLLHRETGDIHVSMAPLHPLHRNVISAKQALVVQASDCGARGAGQTILLHIKDDVTDTVQQMLALLTSLITVRMVVLKKQRNICGGRGRGNGLVVLGKMSIFQISMNCTLNAEETGQPRNRICCQMKLEIYFAFGTWHTQRLNIKWWQQWWWWRFPSSSQNGNLRQLTVQQN